MNSLIKLHHFKHNCADLYQNNMLQIIFEKEIRPLAKELMQLVLNHL